MNVRVNFLFRTYRIQPVIYHWRAGVDCLGDYMYGWLKKVQRHNVKAFWNSRVTDRERKYKQQTDAYIMQSSLVLKT